ncbi:MAG TPA: sugar ABC transporter permease [Lachnoclostridium sp.]|jgi:oligogalacturonide transport system permease protein|uniref:carbohydrate ABC transporter permease n=1 Tax=Lacrimispora sp. TaxID=2719234 RepID=UPI000ED8FF7B|nr:sugar ABC transporter permease [Lacrimispora sp.]HCD46065.1 sugar ABC transporter permease [Lachnoclostridium sp.]
MKSKGIRKVLADNAGFFFILPWLVGFILFKVYPFASSLYYSFTNYDLFNGITKTGVMNYQKIFTDSDIVKAFVVTFKYAIFDVPLKLTFALFVAYILNFKLKGVNFFRTAYYIPSILGGSIAIAILWRAVFNTDGLINTALGVFGIEKINWMASGGGALAVIVLLRVWQFGSAMVIFLAALKGVSEDLYEAASIDGAGKWTQFFKITVPLITPVIFYNLITQLCQAFQEFNGPFLVTKGGPNGATTLISILIYNNAFLRHKMGIASAQAWILFLIVMTFTAVAFISQKKWVYYSDEDGR